jgi:sugar phosphate isomerase/epimerase
MYRRTFLKTSSLACIAGVTGPAMAARPGLGKNGKIRPAISLNAYSFTRPLLAHEMSLEELFQFAAETGFMGVDLTAYYIPGYPEVPEDKILFDIKRMALLKGLAITGTGVRNDFTLADPENRVAEIQLVKDWVVAAAKLGAPYVRVFEGKESPEGHTRAEIKSWIVEGFHECADFASAYGVTIVFQNHNDFIVTREDIVDIIERVHSDWFSFMLDIGSLPVPDPYKDIEKLIQYAVTWQVKENVKTTEGSVPTDFPRLMKIVNENNYYGFFPLETLGEGDPGKKVQALYKLVMESML